MSSPQTDSEIIRKVLAGDVQAYEEIVKRYQDRLLRLCGSMVGPSQAEDAAQDIFIKVYESLAQFKGRSSFYTWLYRVAANHCLNIIAQNKRNRTDSLEGLMEKEDEPARQFGRLDPNLQSMEDRQIVHTVLNQLTPHDRAILVLRELNGLTYQEIADSLELSADLVKVRLFRARQAFLKIAGPELVTFPDPHLSKG